MDKIPITNDSAMPIYVHGVMIPPGETRHFNASDVQAQFRPQPTPEEQSEPANPLLELLQGKVADITALLGGMSEEEIGDIETLENAAKNPRKSLLEAIGAERLKRAQTTTEGPGTGDGATGDA